MKADRAAEHLDDALELINGVVSLLADSGVIQRRITNQLLRAVSRIEAARGYIDSAVFMSDFEEI